MMTKKSEIEKPHVWDRWDWIFHTISYGVLIFQAAIFLSNEVKHASLQIFFGLTAAVMVWYFPLVFKRQALWMQIPARTLAYFVIGWFLWGTLILAHPAAMMLAAMYYPILFMRMPIRWAAASASLLTFGLLAASIFVLGLDENLLPTLVTITGLILGGAIVIGVFINSLISQSVDRQRLIEELSQTRASLLKMEREAGVLAERQRLAREIHDTLAQDFTSIIMHLTAAKLGDSESAVPHVQQAEQTARDGLDEARRIVWAMRPEQLEHSTLVESIEVLAARWSAENSIRVNTAITGTPRPLGPERDAALLRVTQEALNNVKKHANASRVDITLSYMADLTALDIVDDGIGFEEKDQHGFGLKTMRERVEELRGTLTIESSDGTAIAISLPVEDE